jgi:hypothetical protein
MPDIDFIRAHMEHRRRQVQRLRGEIRQFQYSGLTANQIGAICLDRLPSPTRPTTI